jgi:hypothetical protein
MDKRKVEPCIAFNEEKMILKARKQKEGGERGNATDPEWHQDGQRHIQQQTKDRSRHGIQGSAVMIYTRQISRQPRCV